MEKIKVERISYLDNLKGFAILLVVLGHVYSLGNPVRIWIYSFHMPLFFMISGILFNFNHTTSTVEFIKKKFHTLLIPYISFGCLIFIIKLILAGGFTDEVISYILFLCTGVGRDALWFLPTLFFAEVLLKLLTTKIKRKSILFIIISIIFTVGLYGQNLMFNNVYTNLLLITLYRNLVSLGFYSFGYFSFKLVTKKSYLKIPIYILFLCNIFLCQFNGFIDLWKLTFNSKLLYIIFSIIGSLAIIYIFKTTHYFNSKNKVLMFLGQNSLIIMATQQLIIDIINTITHQIYYSYFYGLIIFLIVMLIEIPIIKLINTHCKFMLGRTRTFNALN